MSFDATSVEVSVFSKPASIPDSEWMSVIAMLPTIWGRFCPIMEKMRPMFGHRGSRFVPDFQHFGDFPAELVQYIGMVYFVCNRFCGHGWAGGKSLLWEESFQAGLLGLCKAYVMYRPGSGAEFKTVAFKFIKQAVMNGLRLKNQPQYVKGDGKRTIRELCEAKMRGAKNEDTKKLRAVQYNPETIDARQLRREGFENGLDAIPTKGRVVFIRFDEIPSFDLLTAEQLKELDSQEWEKQLSKELMAQVDEAAKKLTPREREVLALNKEGHLDTHIADKLGITKVAVGQIRKKAIARLREVLN